MEHEAFQQVPPSSEGPQWLRSWNQPSTAGRPILAGLFFARAGLSFPISTHPAILRPSTSRHSRLITSTHYSLPFNPSTTLSTPPADQTPGRMTAWFCRLISNFYSRTSVFPVSPNSQFPANLFYPFHFPRLISKTKHPVLYLDSNPFPCYPHI